MKLYIKSYSSYRSDKEDIDVKKELKQKYKLDTRRQDGFIHLGVLGAQRLKENGEIDEYDELYITTGIGNIDVLQRTHLYVCKENNSITPYDFINMLGNTTSYYVAASLGVHGKTIFQISDNFTYINTLISIYASISQSKKDAIISTIDLVNNPDEVIKRVLGIDEKREVVSSVNYQRLSLEDDDAIAEIEFDANTYSLEEVKVILDNSDTEILSSMRCEKLSYKTDDKFFETMASYAVNSYIKKAQNLIYIDCFEDKYKILKLKSLV